MTAILQPYDRYITAILQLYYSQEKDKINRLLGFSGVSRWSYWSFGVSTGGQNPAHEAPGGEKPAREAPGGENPAQEAPGGENPTQEPPGGQNPAQETP